jgi:hypothetical protein
MVSAGASRTSTERRCVIDRTELGRSGKPGSHPIQEAVEAEFEPFVARLRSIGIDTVIKDTDDVYEQA